MLIPKFLKDNFLQKQNKTTPAVAATKSLRNDHKDSLQMLKRMQMDKEKVNSD